jgi:hypothetical protein
MRRIVHLFIGFLFASASYGQTHPDKVYLFGNLNGAEMPTGYLGPYGTDLLDKEDFNGLATDSNIINSMDIVRMSYAGT